MHKALPLEQSLTDSFPAARRVLQEQNQSLLRLFMRKIANILAELSQIVAILTKEP